MLETYTVSFFGHRRLEYTFQVEKALEELIHDLLLSHHYVEFLVGREGDFDQLVASTVRRCKRTYRDDNSALVLVLPYDKAEFRNNRDSFYEYYDEIEICADGEAAHFKAAYQKRNRYMADRSDLVVLCVQRDTGGAWQTMEYVKKQGICYINLA